MFRKLWESFFDFLLMGYLFNVKNFFTQQRDVDKKECVEIFFFSLPLTVLLIFCIVSSKGYVLSNKIDASQKRKQANERIVRRPSDHSSPPAVRLYCFSLVNNFSLVELFRSESSWCHAYFLFWLILFYIPNRFFLTFDWPIIFFFN